MCKSNTRDLEGQNVMDPKNTKKNNGMYNNKNIIVSDPINSDFKNPGDNTNTYEKELNQDQVIEVDKLGKKNNKFLKSSQNPNISISKCQDKKDENNGLPQNLVQSYLQNTSKINSERKIDKKPKESNIKK